MNLLPASVAAAGSGGVAVALNGAAPIQVPVAPGTVASGAPVTLGIRPEALRPDPAGPLSGKVRLAERLGGLTMLHIVMGDGSPLTVQMEGSDGTRVHDDIRLSVDSAASHVFDAAGQALPHLARHPLAA